MFSLCILIVTVAVNGLFRKRQFLDAAVALYLAYYNFCWMHGSLNGTPVMEAGIAGHPWTLAELIEAIE